MAAAASTLACGRMPGFRLLRHVAGSGYEGYQRFRQHWQRHGPGYKLFQPDTSPARFYLFPIRLLQEPGDNSCAECCTENQARFPGNFRTIHSTGANYDAANRIITFNLPSLNPFGTYNASQGEVVIHYLISPTVTLGTPLYFQDTIFPVTGDTVAFNNYETCSEVW
jgi:hypothetical protein